MIVDTIFVVLASTIVGTAASGIVVAAFSHKLDRAKAPPVAERQEKAAVNPRFDFSDVEEAYQEYMRTNEREERDLFLATGAWWLDPNRWGEDPDWRDRIPAAIGDPFDSPRLREQAAAHRKAKKSFDTLAYVKSLAPPPPCPHCGPAGSAGSKVTGEHGGEPTMWECRRCGCGFTKAGETKASKAARPAIQAALDLNARMSALDNGFMSARDVAMLYNEELPEQLQHPPAVTRPGSVYDDLPTAPYPTLPCGCSAFGEVTTRSYPSAGFDMGRYALCLTCDGTWDYATGRDNYEGKDPRKKVKGEVEWPNGDKRLKTQSAPLVVPVNPQATFRIRGDRSALPCGCERGGAMERHGPLKDGTVWVRCCRCERWWEPSSFDHNGYSLAQGEQVHDADEMNPTTLLAWGRMVDHPERNHGACPSRTCQMPVERLDDGRYRCTSTDCRHAYEPWGDRIKGPKKPGKVMK